MSSHGPGAVAEVYLPCGLMDCQTASCTDEPKIRRVVRSDVVSEVPGTSEGVIETSVPSTD